MNPHFSEANRKVEAAKKISPEETDMNDNELLILTNAEESEKATSQSKSSASNYQE